MLLMLAADLNYDLICCNSVQLVVGVQYNSVRAPPGGFDWLQRKVVINSQHGMWCSWNKRAGAGESSFGSATQNRHKCCRIGLGISCDSVFNMTQIPDWKSFGEPIFILSATISLAKKPEPRLLFKVSEVFTVASYSGGTMRSLGERHREARAQQFCSKMSANILLIN